MQDFEKRKKLAGYSEPESHGLSEVLETLLASKFYLIIAFNGAPHSMPGLYLVL